MPESQTPDPIAYFLEAESDFQSAQDSLCKILAAQITLRESLNSLKRELQEIEADIIMGGLEGKNAEERKAALVQAMAADPRVPDIRDRLVKKEAQHETDSVAIELSRLLLSSARARRNFALVLLQHQTAAQGDRWATIQGGLATIQEEIATEATRLRQIQSDAEAIAGVKA